MDRRIQRLEESFKKLLEENLEYKNFIKVTMVDKDVLKTQVDKLKRQVREQQKEIQVANEKCMKAEQLQVVLKSLFLKKIKENQSDQLTELKYKVNVIDRWVAELEAKADDALWKANGLKDQMPSIKDGMIEFDRRLEQMEEKAELREHKLQDLKQQMNSVKTKIFSSENLNTALDSRLCETEKEPGIVKTDLNDLKTQMNSVITKISSIKNDSTALDSRLCEWEWKAENFQKVVGDMKTKITTNEKSIVTLKANSDTIKETGFYVVLKPSKELNTEDHTRLDRCGFVENAGKHFDQETAYFTAPTKGLYLFTIKARASGNGALEVAVLTGEAKQFLVYPYHRSEWKDWWLDIRCGSILSILPEGTRVGVTAKCLSMSARLELCDFSGSLLCEFM